jgi:hypothetical protein
LHLVRIIGARGSGPRAGLGLFSIRRLTSAMSVSIDFWQLDGPALTLKAQGFSSWSCVPSPKHLRGGGLSGSSPLNSAATSGNLHQRRGCPSICLQARACAIRFAPNPYGVEETAPR